MSSGSPVVNRSGAPSSVVVSSSPHDRRRTNDLVSRDDDEVKPIDAGGDRPNAATSPSSKRIPSLGNARSSNAADVELTNLQQQPLPGTVNGKAGEHAIRINEAPPAHSTNVSGPQASAVSKNNWTGPSQTKDGPGGIQKPHAKQHEEHDHATEFAKEMEHKFGKPSHGFQRLTVKRKPYFQNPKFFHFIHKPQLKQFYRGKGAVLVRENSERKANWNELFFDLVFIVVFEHIAEELHHYAQSDANGLTHLDGRSLTEFVVLFSAAWKLWIDLTVYVDLFDPKDTFHKIYFFMEMVFTMGIAVMSLKGVIGSYLAGTGVTLLLRSWASYYSPRTRTETTLQWLVWAASGGIWLSSLVYDKPEATTENPHPGRADFKHFISWGVGIIVALTGQGVLYNIQSFHFPMNIEHITERFGLFTILCMGAPILRLLFQDTEGKSSSFAMAVLGGLGIFAVQILYYDVEGYQQKMHALRRSKFTGYLWLMVHLPLQCAILIIGVGFKLFIASTLKLHETDASTEEQAAGHAIVAKQRQLFCLSSAAIFLCLFVIGLLHKGKDEVVISKRWRVWLRLVGGAVMIALAFIQDGLISPLAIMAVSSLMMAGLAIFEVYGAYVPIDHTHGAAYREESKSISMSVR